jgi:hypothetical protein
LRVFEYEDIDIQSETNPTRERNASGDCLCEEHGILCERILRRKHENG